MTHTGRQRHEGLKDEAVKLTKETQFLRQVIDLEAAKAKALSVKAENQRAE